MKKITIIVLCIIGIISQSIGQEIPEQIKSMLIGLTIEVDSLASTNPEKIADKISDFMQEAPDEETKILALQFIYNESASPEVKEIVTALLNESSDTQNYVILKNATVIDVVTGTVKKGDVHIKNEKIEALDYNQKLMSPVGSTIYNLEGMYIIPGLIDNHVHITHGTLKDAQDHLQTALKNGVTGVRDMGGDGRMLSLLKKNMQIGEDQGPDVFFSTIIAGPTFFENDPRPQQVAKGAKAGEVSWQKAITDTTDLRQVVAEAKGLGATAIKVYLNVDKELFKKVAKEAHRQGLRVWAHAVVHPTRAIDITNGGADVMSHAGDMVQYEFIKGELKGRHDFNSREEANAYRAKIDNIEWDENAPEIIRLFKAMKNNNSILDATLWVYSENVGLVDPNQYGDSTEYITAYKVTKIAHNMGVKIGAGSDQMIDDDGITINIHGELELLVLAGLSPAEALKSATIINAEGLGEESNIGSIEKGKLANLVVLNSNPLESIKNTRDIALVVKRGKIVVDKTKKETGQGQNTNQRLNPEQQAVANTLQRMFDAMNANDVETSKKLMLEGGQYHTIDTESGHVRKVTFKDYLKDLEKGEEELLERFWNPTVLIDGNLASLFTRYEFLVNDQFNHCGVEVFNFIKVKSDWIISGAAFTVQTEDCHE